MCKYVVILSLISSVLGLIMSPKMLTASDSVAITGVNNLGIVETVIPEPEPEPEPEVRYFSAPAAGTVYEPVVQDGISLGGRIIPIYDVDSTTYDAGNSVYRFNGKLLYGHNSAAVFGRLSDYGYGDTFTITEGGVTTTYMVTLVEMFEKNPNGKLQKDGSGNYMNTVAAARGHSLAIMTCAGQALGGGDATHRLVVYADAI